jgi:hypothetical protein
MDAKTFSPEELAKLDQAFLQEMEINSATTTPPKKDYTTYFIVIISLLAFIIFLRILYWLIKYSVRIITYVFRIPSPTLVVTKESNNISPTNNSIA